MTTPILKPFRTRQGALEWLTQSRTDLSSVTVLAINDDHRKSLTSHRVGHQGYQFVVVSKSLMNVNVEGVIEIIPPVNPYPVAEDGDNQAWQEAHRNDEPSDGLEAPNKEKGPGSVKKSVGAADPAADAGADPAADAGAPDAGAPDAGAPDAGAPDAGAPDAGAPDAGAPDMGGAPAGGGSVDALGAGAGDPMSGGAAPAPTMMAGVDPYATLIEQVAQGHPIDASAMPHLQGALDAAHGLGHLKAKIAASPDLTNSEKAAIIGALHSSGPAHKAPHGGDAPDFGKDGGGEGGEGGEKKDGGDKSGGDKKEGGEKKEGGDATEPKSETKDKDKDVAKSLATAIAEGNSEGAIKSLMAARHSRSTDKPVFVSRTDASNFSTSMRGLGYHTEIRAASALEKREFGPSSKFVVEFKAVR
jgi:hypothetical protein